MKSERWKTYIGILSLLLNIYEKKDGMNPNKTKNHYKIIFLAQAKPVFKTKANTMYTQ